MRKTMALSLLAMVLSASAFAGGLDGKEFCRTLRSGSLMGQPDRERTHCVSFAENVMTDNGNTFFGNPPESIHYVLVDGKVLVVRDGNLMADYSFDKTRNVLKNESGAVLKLQ